MNLNKVKKIVLLTHNDLSVQAGDATLICRRAEEMFNVYGIETYCIVTKNFDTPKHRVKGVTFNTISNKKVLLNKIKEISPELVIIYGIKSYYLIELLRKSKYNFKIYLDIQGVPEEMIDFEKGINKFKVYPKFVMKKFILRYYLKKSDGAFIVTDEMKSYCEALLNHKIQIDYIKIRCGINNILDNDTRSAYRCEIRNILNIDNKNVYVFSGYRKPWQKIDEIIKIFQYIDEIDKDSFFMFFCNTDLKFESLIEKLFPKKNYFIKFLSYDEYNKYLCACDVGFLFRDYLTTNKVAFPNKYSDYLNCGLLVAMNNAVKEPFKISKEYNIEFIDCDKINNRDYLLNMLNIIIHRRNNIYDYYNDCNLICKKELSYSEQIKKIDK